MAYKPTGRPRGRPRIHPLKTAKPPMTAEERVAHEALVAKIVSSPSAHEFERKEPDAAMKAFEAFKVDPGSPSLVFTELTAGYDGQEWPQASLSGFAKKRRFPKGAFVEWFTTEHSVVFDAALKVIAADLAVKAMEAALNAKPEDVAVGRLRAETAMKIASRFDRARYGDDRGRDTATVVIADGGLLGEARELLRRLPVPGRIEREVKSDDAG